jgi:predicted MFS family arabinose efflux permease
LIALSGALGGGLSGMVVAHSSYATLSIAGTLLSLLLIPIVIWAGKRGQGDRNHVPVKK